MVEREENLYDILTVRIFQDENILNELILLHSDTFIYISSLIEGTKTAIKERELSSKQLHDFSVLLLGLTRLPLPTPGIELSVEIGIKGEGGAESLTIKLSEAEFCVGQGGFIRSYGIDSFTIFDLQAGNGYYILDPVSFDLTNSKEMIQKLFRSGSINIYNSSCETQLDWDHEDGGLFREWLELHNDIEIE